MPWTVGEQMRYEDRISDRLDDLDGKLDRLIWIVAGGAGIISAAAFFIGLIAAHPWAL